MSRRSGHGRVDDTLGRGDGDELPGFLGSRVELAPLPYLGGSHDGKTLAPGPAPWTSKRMALAAQTQDAGHMPAARSAARHEGDGSQRSAGGRGSGAREADDGSDAPLVEDGPVSGPPPRFTVSGKGPMLAQVGVADDTPRSRGGGVAAGSLRQGGAVRQHLPSKKEMMTIRTRVRLFEVLDGTATVDDGAGAFLMKALRHLAEVKLMVIAMALSSIPMIWSHQWMHATYLEDLQQHANVTTTERHGMLGHDGMFKVAHPLFWVWTLVFTFFGSTNLLCVSVVWLWIITGYQPLTKAMAWLTVGLFVAFGAYIFGGYLLVGYAGWEIPQLAFNAPAFLSAAVFSWLCGVLYRDVVGMPKLPLVLLIQVLVNAVVFFFYTEWIPGMFLRTNNDWYRLLIRVVMHPILVEAIIGTMRVASLFYPAHLDQSTLVIFLFPAYVVSNLLGRFLVASSSSFGWAVFMTACLSIEEVAMRMTMWRRDYYYLRLFMSAEKAEALAYSKRSRRLKADILSLDQMTEDFGILVSGFIIYFYQMAVTPEQEGQQIGLASICITMLMQFLVEMGTDIAPTLFVVIADNPRCLSATWEWKHKRAMRVRAQQQSHRGQDQAREKFLAHDPATLPLQVHVDDVNGSRIGGSSAVVEMNGSVARVDASGARGPAATGAVAADSDRAAATPVPRRPRRSLGAVIKGTAAVRGAVFAKRMPPLVELPPDIAQQWRAARQRVMMVRLLGRGPFQTPTAHTAKRGAAIRGPTVPPLSPHEAAAAPGNDRDAVEDEMEVVELQPSVRVRKSRPAPGPQSPGSEEAASSRGDASLSPINAEEAAAGTAEGEFAAMLARVNKCRTRRERAHELARQRNAFAWVSVGRTRGDGELIMYRAASDAEIEGMTPTVAERVFKFLQLAEPITYVTRIKRNHVNFLNAWNTTFRGFGVVLWLYSLCWLEYFLRFFSFPTMVMCAARREGESMNTWPEWQFTVCR